MCNFKMNQETKRSDEEKLVEFSEHVNATGRPKVLSVPLDSDKYVGYSKGIVQSTNALNSGPASLPVIFQRENICSKSTNSVTEDLDLRLHGDQIGSNHNTREKCRSIAGQETENPSMNTISTVETVPRERKRWVRPPGVGQATKESSVIIDDLTSSGSVKSARPSNERQTQSEDNVLPRVLTQRMTKSGKNAENVEITYDISNSYYFSPTLGGNKKNVAVSNEMKKSEFLEIQDSCKRFVSKNPVFSFPVDVQSGQNQDVNIVGNNDNASGRAPSPASVSSVTSSRRLEWDSGADVGYQTYHTEDGNNVTGDNLSTIERMAFTRGCSARLRMEPEGIAGSVQNLPTLPSSSNPPKVVNISTSNSTPLAVSTRLELETVKSSTGTDTESDIMPVVKMPRELYFFPPAQDFGNPHSQENVVNVENTSNTEENFLSRKISSSLTDLSECGHCEDHKNTSSLPRSQSHLSLLLEENKQKKIFNAVNNSFALRYHQKKNNGLNAYSASSSSIATVIPKHESPRVLDKLTQTAISSAPDQQSVAVQVFESRNASECEEKNSIGEENSDSDIINDTINNTNKMGYFSQRKPDISQPKTKMCADRLEMCKGAHKRTYIKKHKHSFATEVESIADISDIPKEMSKNSSSHSSSENKSESNFNKSDTQWINQNKEEIIEKYSGTLDSIPSSTHTAGSWAGGDALHGNIISGRRDSSGVVGSANSFEYLPGHVYESNAAAVDQNLHKNIIPEDSSSQSESSHLSLESRLIKNGSFWDDSTNSTLKNDLEKGINLLRGLLDSKSYSSNSKNKLLRMLMNKLIATDYAEDQEKGVEASWKYIEPGADSQEFVNGNIVERHDEITQKITEREDISGESAGEQQLKSKQQVKASPSAHFVADKCVGTVPSERSGLSSTSDKVCHSDVYSESRVETSTTGGQDGSSSNNTISSKKSCSWKDYTTQSEREYEQHNSKNRGNKSILLKLCETERENQLSWISTEIHHLNSLKQLLEKQQKLSQSVSRREMQERGNQKMKKKLTVYEKNNNMTYSDHSSLQTESRYQSSSNSQVETPAKYEEHSIRDDIAGNRFKEPKKHHRRREHFLDTKEVRKSSPKKNTSIKKTISTQVPSSLNVNDANRYGIHTKMSRDNVPTPDSESVSYSLTFEETAGALSDGTAGRINVYGHTLDGSSGKTKESSKISDHTKNKNIEKCSNADVSSKRSHSDPKQNILCCCECRKLLHKVVSDMKHNNSRIKTVDKNVTEKYKSKNSYLEMKRGTNKNFEYNKSNSCTTTSSGTLQDTPELKCGSDESQYQSFAIGKVNTQTKKHLRVQRENFEEKQLDTKGKCPCCGVDEDFQLDDGNWKCVRCMKLRLTSKLRRCQTCGILESELSDIPDNDQNWKCHECLRKELQNLEKCIHCGKKQDISNNKAVENYNNTVSSETPAPTSLGYILTLDTPSRNNSFNLNATKTPLQEIKIKIPRKSRQSVSAKEKTQEKLKKNVEKSRPKTSGSKENKKPDTSLQNKSKQIQKHTINVEGRYYTLQEYLEANRPDFIQNAEYRRQCLDEIAYLRELRQNSKYKLLAIASYPASHLDTEGSSSLNTEFIPPPPLAVKRVFSQRSLRAQTERKYHNLPEVLNRKAEKKRKEDYRTNRLMAEIFAKLDWRIKELEYPYKCST